VHRFTLSLVFVSAAVVFSLVLSAQDVDTSRSEMRAVIERYSADRGSLNRSTPANFSPAYNAQMKQFYADWQATLGRMNFDAISQDGRIDYLLLKSQLDYELRQLDSRARSLAETLVLLPFAQTIIGLEESRRRMESMDSAKAAATLASLEKQIEQARKAVEADGARSVKKSVANRAVATAESLRNSLRSWFGFYNGYDPLFTWWADAPYKAADRALQNYGTFLREKIVGLKPGDSSDIVGDPIGRDGLVSELAREMIPYTPEELIAIANKEYAWCEAEMKKASRELGFGDDWLKAVEHVKGLHVDPGKQPDLIRDLALEAIDFVQKRDLVTIPALARETWRMQMMTPERQLVNPFFTGGEVISVSYPTIAMGHEQKLMSMRGNNIHFARATVFHELIPGHHLQGFMTARYRTHRGAFSTPFWGEGWALYWEMLLWDLDFPKTPENKVGMLFWRMHRAARIIFSLGFHLGQMTPEECIDYLVKRVGHEVDNATAEVRRSFSGNDGPLYQAAYLLGGLQIRSLHQELVGSRRMTNRDFHDAVLKENRIPIEMVRASLTGQKLSKDFASNWKFYGSSPRGTGQ
jgi:uncharacterized protein (DUF885 family)